MIWMGNFSLNEISLIIFNIISYLLILLLPKRLNNEVTCISLLLGLATGMLFDFTLGGGILDFYRQNDTNHYELFDLFYYSLFAPFGYLFMYFYNLLHINKLTFIFYITFWAFFGIAMQWIFTLLHILTYQHNYKLTYSFPIFLLTQTLTGIFYVFITKKDSKAQPNTNS
ncbi:hypothetical protein AN964_10595 [Heyndrickxia shackletonii]|uniref:Uncharacterized protein n=1 Tax=Heyndrickxia shackletonii TaxID=157838 RepID=A0A0Q3WWX1_9BACI|nr:hypothetical protein [Heyndrickxia shackletonii]KQL53903.1 hypothetical protein AN964_10595 [Heyndrickxia shackletonii]MBB2478935.1 hypothetical protein [Bacillus sp. APMAM]NEY97819.1 hypothetical protein [Heyndrickxia shackletonii]RTZ57678.1 hypothetical protein EKO25_01810 [Bacillus sp. SAJ1]